MVINDLEESGSGLDVLCGVVIGLARRLLGWLPQDEGVGFGGDGNLNLAGLTRFQPMTAERRLSKMLVTHS